MVIWSLAMRLIAFIVLISGVACVLRAEEPPPELQADVRAAAPKLKAPSSAKFNSTVSDGMKKPTFTAAPAGQALTADGTGFKTIWAYIKGTDIDSTVAGSPVTNGLVLTADGAGKAAWVPPSAGPTGVLPIGNGGTGSSTQNFVDLTTAQSIAGVKTFTAASTVVNGNLGIGVTNPGIPIDVLYLSSVGMRVKSMASFASVDIDSKIGDAAIRLAKDGVLQWNLRNNPSTNSFEIFELGGGGSRVTVQDNTGNVGIGTTTPAARVDAIAAGAAGRFENNAADSTADAVTVVNAGFSSRGLVVSNTNASSPGTGVDVDIKGTGSGIFANAALGNGVWGVTNGPGGAGVLGDNRAGGEAVVGRASFSSDPNHDGNGIGAVVGRNDMLNGYGVSGFTTKSGGVGVRGGAGSLNSLNNIAGRFENFNAANTSDVLQVKTNGTGKLLTLTSGTTEIGSYKPDGSFTTTTAPGAFGFTHNDTGGRSIATYCNANAGWIGTISNHPLFFYTNNSIEQMALSTAGNLGIGRAAATNKLEVEGNASKTTATAWLANSDRRIKKDIRTVSGALARIDQVRAVTFRYTDEYRKAHPSVEDRDYFNVIAQEFQQVFPDAVKGSGEKMSDGSEILQVDTYPATITALAAIKELNAKHDAAMKQKDAELAALKERLARIEKLLEVGQPRAVRTLAEKE